MPVGFILISGALLALTFLSIREETIASAHQVVRAFANVTEEQTSQTIKNVEQTLELAAAKLSGVPPPDAGAIVETRAAFRSLLVARPFIRAIWALDANGRIVFDSDEGNIGADLSDREYFKYHRDNPAAGFHFSGPVLSRSTGKWFISATRSWRGADGKFLGVVVAAVEVAYFTGIWTADDVAGGITIALFNRAGILYARSPFDAAAMGKSFHDKTSLFSSLITQKSRATYQADNLVDGRSQIVSYAELSAYPDLIVVVGQTLDQIIGPWRRYMWIAGIAWALASLALGALAAWLLQQSKRRQMAEARYRLLFDANPYPMCVFDFVSLRILAVNDAAVKQYGWSRDEFLAMSLGDMRPAEDVPRMLAAKRTLVVGESKLVKGFRHLKKDGTLIDVECAVSLIDFGGERAAIEFMHDVTERNRAETAGRAMEEQFRQAQKMEAIGQLTGGVAHDFNNMLTVIMGNAEILAERLAGQPALRALAESVLRAAEGSADLTNRLLAFSRRQSLQPERVGANRFVTRAERLLRRVLGEQIDIKLNLGADKWPVMIDPAQLESAVLNLAINARDAMPKGGQLTIETANVHIDENYATLNKDATVGDFVMIAISDNGTGMTQEIIQRAFDPFFTTKEVGKGTGLGLSMVYGFVRQSGGHVKIYSELGHGTTIKMYLPRATDSSFSEATEDRESDINPAKGETILLVEDNDMVRQHVAEQLRDLGYQLVVAENGRRAIELLSGEGKIDLLFTDVVMPGGVSGPDVADKARQLRPGIRVLFTSGYTENSIVHHGRLDPGVNLLSKPYHLRELAAKIRKVLEDG